MHRSSSQTPPSLPGEFGERRRNVGKVKEHFSENHGTSMGKLMMSPCFGSQEMSHDVFIFGSPLQFWNGARSEKQREKENHSEKPSTKKVPSGLSQRIGARYGGKSWQIMVNWW